MAFQVAKRYCQIMFTVPLAELQRRHATEMQGKLIGLFNPAMFVKDLMSIKNEDLAAIPKDAKFYLPPKISKDEVRDSEKRLYQLFVSEPVSSFIH
jgi:hypothetical protein